MPIPPDVPKPSMLSSKDAADSSCNESQRKPRRALGHRYKPELPPSAYAELGRLVCRLTSQVAKHPELSRAIKKSPKAFRKDSIHLIVTAFPLKRGRPTDPLLDEACDLVLEGKPIPVVLRQQIKDWHKLDSYTRYLAAKGLRQAASRRQSLRRTKQSSKT
jgi:hypothetical protein